MFVCSSLSSDDISNIQNSERCRELLNNIHLLNTKHYLGPYSPNNLENIPCFLIQDFCEVLDKTISYGLIQSENVLLQLYRILENKTDNVLKEDNL